MNSNEWPLVFFTLFSQISAGMIVSWLIITVWLKRQNHPANKKLEKGIALTALVFMGSALLISFLHLARPMQAVHALQGFGSSWLSREILLATLFLILLTACYLSLRFSILNKELFGLLIASTALVSLLLIYTMARLYMLPTIPSWNNPATPVAFFNSALLLGSVAVLLLAVLFFYRRMDQQAFATAARILVVLTLAGATVHAANGILLIPDAATKTTDVVIFLPELVPAIWNLARWVFLVIGSASLIFWQFRFNSLPFYANPWLVSLAAICFMLAEICSRYLFYASYYRVGM